MGQMALQREGKLESPCDLPLRNCFRDSRLVSFGMGHLLHGPLSLILYPFFLVVSYFQMLHLLFPKCEGLWLRGKKTEKQ